jgi:hypothetical protein
MGAAGRPGRECDAAIWALVEFVSKGYSPKSIRKASKRLATDLKKFCVNGHLSWEWIRGLHHRAGKRMVDDDALANDARSVLGALESNYPGYDPKTLVLVPALPMPTPSLNEVSPMLDTKRTRVDRVTSWAYGRQQPEHSVAWIFQRK